MNLTASSYPINRLHSSSARGAVIICEDTLLYHGDPILILDEWDTVYLGSLRLTQVVKLSRGGSSAVIIFILCCSLDGLVVFNHIIATFPWRCTSSDIFYHYSYRTDNVFNSSLNSNSQWLSLRINIRRCIYTFRVAVNSKYFRLQFGGNHGVRSSACRPRTTTDYCWRQVTMIGIILFE